MSTLKTKKLNALESSLDLARSSRDWPQALNFAKKLSKASGSNLSVLEDIINGESLIDKDPKQAATILSKAIEKEPDNSVRIILFTNILLVGMQ